MNAIRVRRLLREVRGGPMAQLFESEPPRHALRVLAFAFTLLLACALAAASPPRWDLKPGANVYPYPGAPDGKLSPHVLVFMPEGFQQRKSPLILVLHGAGLRGSDAEKLRANRVLRYALGDPSFPFILVSPQAPEGAAGFDTASLAALLDDLALALPVDLRRIYVTGSSMGSGAAWRLGAEHPRRFAAIVPVSSTRPDPAIACALNETPIWAFHNEGDETARLEPVRAMIGAITACEGLARLTVYAKAGHDAWADTYANPELYRWLLQRYRGSVEDDEVEARR